MPLNEAGLMTEPPVCVPKASCTCRSATAAPDPDEEPPGVCAKLFGLRDAARRPPAPNSTVSVLPRTIAPLRRATQTQAASRAGRGRRVVGGWHPTDINEVLDADWYAVQRS